jgi:homoserine kinase type II
MTDAPTVWLAWHEHESDGASELKLVGVFSTRERAEAAIEARRGKPGFVDHPDGFEISSYVIDGDAAWLDGFVTVH